jgi:hypothetical protein
MINIYSHTHTKCIAANDDCMGGGVNAISIEYSPEKFITRGPANLLAEFPVKYFQVTFINVAKISLDR